jgi:hypothetical protein
LHLADFSAVTTGKKILLGFLGVAMGWTSATLARCL